MNKIHYTSGSFFIEKDGKKIKIANPELLPCKHWLECRHPNGDFIYDGEVFSLPKELSVEICPGDLCPNAPINTGCYGWCKMYECAQLKKNLDMKMHPEERKQYENRKSNAILSKSNDSKLSNSSNMKGELNQECTELYPKLTPEQIKEREEAINWIRRPEVNSPEIPDNSTSIDNVDQLRLALNEDRVKELEAFIKGIAQSLYIGEDLKDKEVLEHYVQVVSIIKEQIKELLPSPPTVAGTSTELLNKLKEKEKQIDADMRSRIPTPEQMQVRVGISCSKIPNNSEKPDFAKIAKSLFNESSSAVYRRNGSIVGMEEIWYNYVIPRDKTISDLRERVKNADDLFNCIKTNQDVLPSWMKEAYENYAKGKR